MAALTLVMQEVDMNAEEFVNVRAYHSRGRGEARPASPAGSVYSSGVSSLTSSSSDEEPTAAGPESAKPSSTASEGADPKEQNTKIVIKKDKHELSKDEQTDIYEEKSKVFAKKDKPEPLTAEKIDIKIMYGGRNILNLGRTLLPYQWQLTSPLVGCAYSLFESKKKSSFRFIERCGTLEEKMTTCGECDYREPILF